MASEAVQIVAEVIWEQISLADDVDAKNAAESALSAIRAALDAGNEDVANALGLTVETCCAGVEIEDRVWTCDESGRRCKIHVVGPWREQS